MINGIDVSDPTRAFTNEEWEALRFNGGQAYVMQAREKGEKMRKRLDLMNNFTNRNQSCTPLKQQMKSRKKMT